MAMSPSSVGGWQFLFLTVRADTCLWTCVIQALWTQCIYPSRLYRAAHLKHEHDLFSEGIRANPLPAFSYIHMQGMRWGSKWLASFNVFKLRKKEKSILSIKMAKYVSLKLLWKIFKWEDVVLMFKVCRSFSVLPDGIWYIVWPMAWL